MTWDLDRDFRGAKNGGTGYESLSFIKIILKAFRP